MSAESFEAWMKTYQPDFSSEEGRFAAETLLAVPIGQRDAKAREVFLDHPAVVLPLVQILHERWEASPATVRDDAEYLYRFLEKVPPREKGQRRTGNFIFDQREYYLGEAALIAGTTCRDLSRREEAREWFALAESWFLFDANPGVDFSRVLYQRLALLTEERRFEDVLKLIPQLNASFENLGMMEDALKCRTLEGNVLKEMGRLREASEMFREVLRRAREVESERMVASACVNLVQLHADMGEPEQAIHFSNEAVPLLGKLDCRIDLAKVQAGLGLLYRAQGNPAAAVEAFRCAQQEFIPLGMRADVAALHLVIADLLLETGQDRQAEWEVRAALPAIEEYGLVPEGAAALTLLRDALRYGQVDRRALRELHGYFPAQAS